MAFTIDLPEDEDRALTRYCFEMAEHLRLPRVPKVAVIRELLHQLETDAHTRETVTAALQERHRTEP